jgi:hypothetical protein
MATTKKRRSAAPEPLVVYVASSLDGTSFALDGAGRRDVRAAFPGLRAFTTRRIFIAPKTDVPLEESLLRFEEHVAVLLTGIPAEELVKKFGAVSFRDVVTDAEVGRVPGDVGVEQAADMSRARMWRCC